jgi:hypothetical protein
MGSNSSGSSGSSGSDGGGGSSGNGSDSGTSGGGNTADSSGGMTGGSAEQSGFLTEVPVMKTMFSAVSNNDLKSLKKFLDDDSQSGISPLVNSIEYSYDITPQIYLADTTQRIWRVNPDITSDLMGTSKSNSLTSMTSSLSLGMKSGLFSQMPTDLEMVKPQYDLLAGSWPTAYDEMVLVTGPDGKITDYQLYILGLRDPGELEKIIQAFQNQETVVIPDSKMNFSFDDVMNIDMRIIPAYERYTFDNNYGVWVDRSQDEAFMKDLIAKSTQLKIVGVVTPSESSNITALSTGIGYMPDLIKHLMDDADNSDIVQEQLANPSVDVFSGKTFDQLDKDTGNFDMSKIITVDKDALASALNFDSSALGNIDVSSFLDLSKVASSLPSMPAIDVSQMFSGIQISDLPLQGISNFASEILQAYLTERAPELQIQAGDLVAGFMDYLQTPEVQDTIQAKLANVVDQDGLNALALDVTVQFINYCGQKGIVNPADMIAALPGWLSLPENSKYIQEQLAPLIDQTALQDLALTLLGDYLQGADISLQGLTSGILDDFSNWLSEPANAKLLSTSFAANVNLNSLIERLSSSLSSYLQTSLQSYLMSFTNVLTSQIKEGMSSAMSKLSGSLAEAMNFDTDAFQNAFKFNLGENELSALMMQMLNTEQKTLDSNLKTLGYASLDSPYSISIYPKDFESKQGVVETLDGYNKRMEDSGQKDKIIVYTDIFGALMSSMTTIVGWISVVLVIFVGISLLVSSIMIGIVTYISVLERKKEIGILRSIGASKWDIGSVFTAETLIVGLISGVLGVSVILLLCIPVNIIIDQIFNIPDIAQLAWAQAAILIAISCLLSFLAGLIPSVAAAWRDPVEALRSD